MPLSVCYLANANSPHTHRWLAPVVADGAAVTLISYKPVTLPPRGVEVVDLTQINNTPRLRFLIWALWVRRFLRNLRPDVVHAHQLQAAGWLGALSGYHPFVASAWGSDLLQTPQRSASARRWVTAVLRRCDALTVPSSHMASIAGELGGSCMDVRVIPWGVDENHFSPDPADRLQVRQDLGIDSDAPLVFCPRSITATYGIDVVLQAIAKLTNDRPSVRLALIRYGVDAGYMKRIEALQADLGLENGVFWLPPQEGPAAMAALYRASDIVISIPAHEGYGASVYEAMACGRPTIISDLPAFADVPNGTVTRKVTPGSVVAAAEALAELFAAPDKRRLMGEEAARFVRRTQSVASRVAATRALYDDLCGDRVASSGRSRDYP